MDFAYIGKNASECSCKRRGAEEEGDPVLTLPALIPHTKVEHHLWFGSGVSKQPKFTGEQHGSRTYSREQAAFRSSEEESSYQESCRVLDDTQQSRHNSLQESMLASLIFITPEASASAL